MLTLIKALLGSNGATALQSLLKTDLNSYIAPRAIVSWLKYVPYGETDIPVGVPLQRLVKNGYGFSGSAVCNDFTYDFKHACEEQVAAIILTSLGVTIEAAKTRDLDLAKLAKTIDALAKNQKDQRIKHNKIEDTEPIEHTPPIPKQAETKKKTVRIPGLKRSSLRLSEEESHKNCQTCGEKMFKNEHFEGCVCYKPLAKNITTTKTSGGYLLTVNGPDAEVICALIKDFK